MRPIRKKLTHWRKSGASSRPISTPALLTGTTKKTAQLTWLASGAWTGEATAQSRTPRFIFCRADGKKFAVRQIRPKQRGYVMMPDGSIPTPKTVDYRKR